MSQNNLSISVGLQIQKQPSEIFEAIVNPAIMKNYFISKSTGRMEEGAKLVWNFPEFNVDCLVHVLKVEENKLISFEWEIDGKMMTVEIKLEKYNTESTIVKITEDSYENTDKGIAWLKGNTEGWSNFLNCLKAFLEFGINLRKGSFDYRK